MYEVTIPEYLSPTLRTSSIQDNQTWHIDKIRLNLAHRTGILGNGVRVAVLDSGIDADHPHFNGMVEAGLNFIPDEEFEDLGDHGTHVAGLIHTVAPLATIVNVKILNSGNQSRWSIVNAAIRWAATEGNCDIINMSIGGMLTSSPPGLDEAIGGAVNAGVVLVAASGNGGSSAPVWPAHDAWVWSVGACDINGALWGLTSTGDLDLIAPGVQVYSSVPSGGYGFKTGTSMASPVAAGCMALSLEKFGDVTAVGGEGDEQRMVSAADAVGFAKSIWIPFMAG